jgi:hypothetical protein
MAFITDSTDIRDMFAWAHPMQVLQAIRVYSTSFYGCMLFNLYGEESKMIYRCWNTAAKLTWDVPWSTFTFLVDRVLSGDMASVRDGILTRYDMFLQSLHKSNSKEIRILASISSVDGRSTTESNTMKISRETDLDLRACSRQTVKNALSQRTVPEEEEWRIPLLARLLKERRACIEAEEDSKHLDSMIVVVCSSTFD